MYLDWAEKNKFQSILPKDARRHCDTASANEQTCLDSHLKELPLKEKVLPYTDELFSNVAIEWLVTTDQVRGFDWLISQKINYTF